MRITYQELWGIWKERMLDLGHSESEVTEEEFKEWIYDQIVYMLGAGEDIEYEENW